MSKIIQFVKKYHGFIALGSVVTAYAFLALFLTSPFFSFMKGYFE